MDEIHTIVERCGDTAKICQQAGFDGIEIHAVHEGYLLDQFAIPFFNKRTENTADAWRTVSGLPVK